MTVTDLHTAVTIPAGWYPDPADASGLRWWSGENWTEHTSAPEPVVVEPAFVEPAFVEPAFVEPAFVEPAFVEPAFFQPALFEPMIVGPMPVAPTPAAPRKVSHRDRSVFSGMALVAAVLGLLVFVAGQLLELPDVILYLAGGASFAIAAVAIVVAIRTGRGMTLAIIAAVLSALNVGMVWMLGATEVRDDLGTTIQDSATFEQVLEQSVVQTANTLGMTGVATAADCPDVPTPAKGTVTDCTVTFDTGDTYLVHVTSKDGLGGMAFELVDTPLPAGSAPSEG